MSHYTPYVARRLTARLTQQGIPWDTCQTWRGRIDDIENLGWNTPQMRDDLHYLFSWCVLRKTLPLYINVHPILDNILGRILNGDVYVATPWCLKIRDYDTFFEKLSQTPVSILTTTA